MANPAVALFKNAYAYEEMRRRILTGDIAQGSVPNQAQLAHELGVSTTPLREALRRLAAKGLVQLESHRDARVASLTAEEARDLNVIRENLDPLAAGLAAESRTPADTADIEAALKQLTPLRDASTAPSTRHHITLS